MLPHVWGWSSRKRTQMVQGMFVFMEGMDKSIVVPLFLVFRLSLFVCFSCFLHFSFCPMPLFASLPIIQLRVRVWMERDGRYKRFSSAQQTLGWVEPVSWPGCVHIPQWDPGATCDPLITVLLLHVWVGTSRHLATRGTRGCNVLCRCRGNRDYVSRGNDGLWSHLASAVRSWRRNVFFAELLHSE